MSKPVAPVERDLLIGDQEDRQLMASILLPNTGSLTPEQRLAVAHAVKQHMAEHDLGEAQVARACGLGTTTVYNIIHQNVTDPKKLGNRDSHLRELNLWMEADARRRATKPAKKFVRTKVARKILDAAKVANTYGSGRVVLVVGPTGVGKTMVGHVVYEQTPGAIYLRLGRHLRTYTRLRNRLADLLKVGNSGRLQRSLRELPIEDRIFETLRDTHRLLILDEGHQISNDGLDFLRDLFDETRIPILVLCTIDLWQRIQREADEDHGQWFSRVTVVQVGGSDSVSGGRDNQKLFRREEIVQLYQTPKVRLHADAVEFLVEVANALGHGSLRRCDYLVEFAIAEARKEAGSREAAVELTGDFLARVEEKYLDSRTGTKALRDRRALGAAPLAATA
jgi:DNA transposition AAA+ family ATPase